MTMAKQHPDVGGASGAGAAGGQGGSSATPRRRRAAAPPPPPAAVNANPTASASATSVSARSLEPTISSASLPRFEALIAEVTREAEEEEEMLLKEGLGSAGGMGDPRWGVAAASDSELSFAPRRHRADVIASEVGYSRVVNGGGSGASPTGLAGTARAGGASVGSPLRVRIMRARSGVPDASAETPPAVSSTPVSAAGAREGTGMYGSSSSEAEVTCNAPSGTGSLRRSLSRRVSISRLPSGLFTPTHNLLSALDLSADSPQSLSKSAEETARYYFDSPPYHRPQSNGGSHHHTRQRVDSASPGPRPGASSGKGSRTKLTASSAPFVSTRASSLRYSSDGSSGNEAVAVTAAAAAAATAAAAAAMAGRAGRNAVKAATRPPPPSNDAAAPHRMRGGGAPNGSGQRVPCATKSQTARSLEPALSQSSTQPGSSIVGPDPLPPTENGHRQSRMPDEEGASSAAPGIATDPPEAASTAAAAAAMAAALQAHHQHAISQHYYWGVPPGMHGAYHPGMSMIAPGATAAAVMYNPYVALAAAHFRGASSQAGRGNDGSALDATMLATSGGGAYSPPPASSVAGVESAANGKGSPGPCAPPPPSPEEIFLLQTQMGANGVMMGFMPPQRRRRRRGSRAGASVKARRAAREERLANDQRLANERAAKAAGEDEGRTDPVVADGNDSESDDLSCPGTQAVSVSV